MLEKIIQWEMYCETYPAIVTFLALVLMVGGSWLYAKMDDKLMRG